MDNCYWHTGFNDIWRIDSFTRLELVFHFEFKIFF